MSPTGARVPRAASRRRTPDPGLTDSRQRASAKDIAAITLAAIIGLAAMTPVGAVGEVDEQRPSALVALEAADPLPLSRRTERNPSVHAYRGLGAWVDIFDDRAFDRPEAAVADMHSHGVHTIFVETGNSSHRAIHRPDRMRRLITAAHARGMHVVAWYLPTLKNPESDYRKIRTAIRFRTDDGQRFDSFVLDIESGVVDPVRVRNARLDELSRRIRRLAGPRYPLGACIPSPKGMADKPRYWKPFPYQDLAEVYDVFLPMGYYTYHGNGSDLARSDTIANVRILRAQPGCGDKAVHVIGGLAGDSSAEEVRAFISAARRERVEGAGIYDWQTTKPRHWLALSPARSLGALAR